MQPLGFPPHLLTQFLVQCRKRLIHEQQARVIDDRPRQGDTLLLAAESWLGIRLPKPASRTLSRARSASARRTGRLMPRIFSGKATLSSTDKCGNKV